MTNAAKYFDLSVPTSQTTRFVGCTLATSYWLDNKYPYPGYAVNTGNPLDIKTPGIKCEEAK